MPQMNNTEIKKAPVLTQKPELFKSNNKEEIARFIENHNNLSQFLKSETDAIQSQLLRWTIQNNIHQSAILILNSLSRGWDSNGFKKFFGSSDNRQAFLNFVIKADLNTDITEKFLDMESTLKQLRVIKNVLSSLNSENLNELFQSTLKEKNEKNKKFLIETIFNILFSKQNKETKQPSLSFEHFSISDTEHYELLAWADINDSSHIKVHCFRRLAKKNQLTDAFKYFVEKANGTGSSISNAIASYLDRASNSALANDIKNIIHTLIYIRTQVSGINAH